MTQIGMRVKVTFDILRGLVTKHLCGPIVRDEHITAIDKEPGQIRQYDLCVDGMNLGSILIERVDEYLQDLTIIPPPPLVSRDWSDEEKRLLNEQRDADTKRATVTAITADIMQERDTQQQMIQHLHEQVITWLLEQLEIELNWRQSEGLDWRRSQSRKATSRHYVSGQHVQCIDVQFSDVTEWLRQYLIEGHPLPEGVIRSLVK